MLAVEGDAPGEDTEPLLLLAVNGTMEADWDVMRVKACMLAIVVDVRLSNVTTGAQVGDVSCAVGEQAPGIDGRDGDDAEVGKWEQESDAEYGDVAWTGVEVNRVLFL